MKKLTSFTKALALATALLAGSQSFAFDFGGTVGNTTTLSFYNFETTGIKQQNPLSLWAKVPFNNSGTTYLATEGTFMFQYSTSDISSESGSTNLVLDLPLLKFSHLVKFDQSTSLQLSAGRFYVTDLSGFVFLQPSDGAMGQFSAQRITASLYAGYTGLLNALNVTELNESGSAYSYNSDLTSLYDFASPYLVFAASVGAPYVLLNQSVSLEGVLALGTKGPNGDNSGYNRGYATLTLNGPILASLFYTLGTTFSTENFNTIGNLTSASLSYYFGAFASSVGLSAVYASPNFKGISSNTATLASDEPEYNSLLKAELVCSFKPLSTLFVGANAGVVFSAPADSFSYDGVQFALSSRFQAFTDLQLGLSASQYVGSDSSKTKTSITANAVISF